MEKNLLNNVSEITKVKIRFPNESIYDEISINLNDFKVDKEFYCNLSKEHKDYKWVSLCDSKKIVLSPKSRRLIKHIKDKVF